MNQALTEGGATKRVVRLRVIGGFVDLRNDVPETMADCPKERSLAGHIVCGHVKCEYHLWLVEGHDRPGRWRDGRIGSELRPVWLEWPLPPCCADDLAKQGKSIPEIAKAMGLGTTRFHDVLRTATGKMKASGRGLREFVDEDAETPEPPAARVAAFGAGR